MKLKILLPLLILAVTQAETGSEDLSPKVHFQTGRIQIGTRNI